MVKYFPERTSYELTENSCHFFQCCLEQNHIVAPHTHPAVEMLFIVSGTYKVVSENNEHFATAGEMILFRSGTVHSVYPSDYENNEYYVIQVDEKFIRALSSAAKYPFYMLALTLQNDASKTFWTARECEELEITQTIEKMIEEKRKGGYGSDIAIKCGCSTVILALLRTMEKDSSLSATAHSNDTDNIDLTQKIFAAIIYVHNHYHEQISAKSCAESLHFSYSYFSRRFKEITGQSFTELLNITRVKHAERLLISTDMPITQVAYECGFNDHTYFCSVFKKVRGITPSERRNKR